jgi:hypothetical protein
MVDNGDRKMEAVLARAQAAVADLAKSYAPNTIIDLDRCATLLKTARENPAARASSVKDLYGIAHNIKGQGAPSAIRWSLGSAIRSAPWCARSATSPMPISASFRRISMRCA